MNLRFQTDQTSVASAGNRNSYRLASLSLACCLLCVATSSVTAQDGKTFTFANGVNAELQTMVPTTIRFAKGAEPKLTSATAADFDCSRLITSQTDRSVTLLLKGDADPRCGDELKLTSGRASMSLRVIPTPGRVVNFVEMPGNPQPAIQSCPDWDCLNHTDPSIGRLPSGETAIWFAAGGNRGKSKPVVGRAVYKKDLGWVLDDEPVMIPEDKPTFWDIARETPSVRWNAAANAWDMWYLGYRTGYHVDPAIGQARSLDPEGTQWTRPAKPVYRPRKNGWDGTFLTAPGAVMGSDGIWRLYYVGANTTTDAMMRVGVLVSNDGENWKPYSKNPIFEGVRGEWDYNLLDTHVQFVGGRYVMWYTGLPGQLRNRPPLSIGVAVSEDGYQWERLQKTPVIVPVKGWTERDVLDVEVMSMADGTLLMAGYGHSIKGTNPAFPNFNPGRIGLWKSPAR